MKNRKKLRSITVSALTAALYVLLTVLSNAFGLASGAVQLRLSEMLNILPAYTSAAIPGLAVGCLLANLLTGAALWDVVFGAAATLLGAAGAYLLRKHPFLRRLPPIAANTLIVPFVLRYAYTLPGTLPFFFLTVGVGEVLSSGVLGAVLEHAGKRLLPYLSEK